MSQTKAPLARLVSSGVLVFAACGEPPAASHASFIIALAENQCERAFRCEQGSADAAYDRALHSQAECHRELRAVAPVIDAYIAAGTTAYDRDSGEACLESFDALCAGGGVSACLRVWRGLVPVGGACQSYLQCASGVCSNHFAPACGTCLATVGDGVSCAHGEHCRTGSFCPLGTDAVCTPNETQRVVVQAERGESCRRSSSTDVVCGPGAYCDETEHCASRIALGGPCRVDTDACAFGASCEALGRYPTCVVVTTAKTEGAACGRTKTGFVRCDETRDLYCAESDKCVRADEEDVPAEDLPNGSACREHDECRSAYCERGRYHGLVCADIPTCH